VASMRKPVVIGVAVFASLSVGAAFLIAHAFSRNDERRANPVSACVITEHQSRLGGRVGVLAAVPGLRELALNSPRHCVRLKVTYSNNRHFAKVELINPTCPGYLGNPGSAIVRKTGKAWTEVFIGSSEPSCSAGIPVELVRPWRCSSLAGYGARGEKKKALAYVDEQGYAPRDMKWDLSANLNAITSSTKASNGSLIFRAYFFYGRKPVGFFEAPSTHELVQEWRGSEVIAIREHFQERGRSAFKLRLFRYDWESKCLKQTSSSSAPSRT